MLLFSVAYLLHPQAEHWLQPIALVVLISAFGIFTFNSSQVLITREMVNQPQFISTRSINYIFLLVATLFLGILVEINTNKLGVSFLKSAHQHIQMLILLGGAVLVTLALCDWRGLTIKLDVDVWIAISFTLLALIIRIWDLQTAVSVPLSDEYAFLDTAVALWDKPDYPMLEPLGAGFLFPWTHPYLVLSSMEVFGWDLLQARLPSAIFGALAIPALYLFTRVLFDRSIAIVACLILATFPPHIHLSRMILNNIYDSTFGLWAFALIAYGYSKRSSPYFILAGVVLAFTQYFYEAGRLVFPPLSAVLIVILLWHDPLQELRRWIRVILRGIFSFVLLASPIYLTLLALDYPLFGRFELVAPSADIVQFVIDNTTERNILSDVYLERLGGTLLHFVQRVDNSTQFYGGTQAMVLTLIAPIFLLGIFVIIRYWRRAGHQFIIFWLFAIILGISFVRIGAWTARFTPIFPAIALIIAIGLVYLCRIMTNGNRQQVIVVAVGALCVMGIQLNYYFGEHLDAYNEQARIVLDETDAFHRAITLPEGTIVNYVDDQGIFMPHIITLMRLWRRTDLQIEHYFYEEITSEQLIAMSQRESSQIFFVDPELNAAIDLITQIFQLDGPYFSPYSDIPQHRQYALYYAVSR